MCQKHVHPELYFFRSETRPPEDDEEEEEEILGSDDDEQEDPKDYVKGSKRFLAFGNVRLRTFFCF